MRTASTVLRPTDLIGVIAVGIWLVWVLINSLITGQSFSLAHPYFVAPVFVLVGVILGRLTLRYWHQDRGATLGQVVMILMVLYGLATLVSGIYANAQAAVGLQLVAVAGLSWLVDDRTDRSPTMFVRATSWLIVLIGAALIVRATAAVVLFLPLAVLVAWAVLRRPRVRAVPLALVSAVLMVAAATVVVWLGTRGSWPEWLNAGDSLSWARHTLWADALELWSQHPLLGAGVGAFTGSSELASSTPHLAMVHSSVLQVGAELGAIGLVLFAALLGIGILIATRGSGPAALIGVAAWTALFVHSVIDHLYEFPMLAITAGLVIGWASSTSTPIAGDD